MRSSFGSRPLLDFGLRALVLASHMICWQSAPQQLVKIPKQEQRQNLSATGEKAILALFCEFSGLARPLQSIWHARRMVRTSGSGKKKMTYANLSQVAASLVAALVASTIFISAAVGPVGQFI
jgi:hypothetical protein